MIFPVPLSVIGTTGTLVLAATLNAPFYIKQQAKTINFRKKYLNEKTRVKLDIITVYLEKISRPLSGSYNSHRHDPFSFSKKKHRSISPHAGVL